MDYRGIYRQEEDSMVILVGIDNYNVKRSLIDRENSVDVIFNDAYDKLGLPTSIIKT